MTQRGASDPYGGGPEVRSGTSTSPRSGSYVPRTGTYLARTTTERQPTRRRGGGGAKVLLFLLALGAAVLFAFVAFAGPALGGMARGIADGNPDAMRIPFIADAVRSHVGDELTQPASDDATAVRFQVASGANAQQIGDDLVGQGLLKERILFTYLVVTRGVGDELQAGTYSLNAAMTPEQIVDKLQDAPDRIVVVGLKEGLRIEQITAKLQTLDLEMDVKEFYELAKDPPASLRADYAFLETLPEGRSLEGYLAAGTYQVYAYVTPEQLIRQLLDQWEETVGQPQIDAARAAGKDFYEVLTLASIVEREAALDSERPLIAGVYQNRIDLKRQRWLNADPTVFYAWDTVQLSKMKFDEWQTYAFWRPPGVVYRNIELPDELKEYNSYVHQGQIPGPICTPTLKSIQAAIAPDQEDGYYYFVAKPDGSRSHAFAKTIEEHRANLKKFGY